MATKDKPTDSKANATEDTKAWGKAEGSHDALLPGSQPDKPLNVAVVPAQPQPPPEQPKEPIKPPAPELPEDSGNLAGYPMRPENARKALEKKAARLVKLEGGRTPTETMLGQTLVNDDEQIDPVSLVQELHGALYAANWHRSHPRLLARVEKWLSTQDSGTSSSSESKSGSATTSSSDKPQPSATTGAQV